MIIICDLCVCVCVCGGGCLGNGKCSYITLITGPSYIVDLYTGGSSGSTAPPPRQWVLCVCVGGGGGG